MIGITAGDPAGIGPEVIIKALALFDTGRFVIYAPEGVMEDAMESPGLPRFKTRYVHDLAEVEGGVLNVKPTGQLDSGAYKMGESSAACGRAAFECIKASVEDAKKGLLSSVVTAPVNKVSFSLGKVGYIGHTEAFADLTGTTDPLTMFQVGRLRTFFLSRHVSLVEACSLVKRERLVSFIPRCIAELDKLGVTGTFAVAGLNPHCGDGGLFGTEDEEVSLAVADCRAAGLDVVGPVGADSVYHQCLMGRYSAVLSLYHDQGHIATKTYDFNRTVSLTLGLGFPRISVDHGTAFDIAGRGVADETGMKECLSLAIAYEDGKEGGVL